MEKITQQANACLVTNPNLARMVLSDAEYRAAVNNFAVARMNYGKAVERLATRSLQKSEIGNYVRHLGGPMQPDFETIYSGAIFDITTPRQVGPHLLRPYGNELQIFTYQRPSTFQTFP